MKNLLVLFLFSVLVFGCKNDDAVEGAATKKLFTFTDDLSNATEMWIILRDSETGELIDSKQVEKNVPLVFESDEKISNDKLSITQLIIGPAPGFISAAVYNGIDVGRSWTGKTGSNENQKGEGNFFGSYSLSISGVPNDALGYTLSNGVNEISYLLSHVSNTLSGDVSLYSNSRDHLISIYPKTGNPKYQFFKAIADGSDITTSYSDLKTYDKILNVKFPMGERPSGLITLADNGYSYTLYQNLGLTSQPDDLTEINLGFLNAFNNYYVNLDFNNYSFEYLSYGPPPTLIQFVDSDLFTISDKGINKFGATASHSYNFRAIHYIYDDPNDQANIDLTYYDPSNGARHNDPFTPELISKYSIPMDKVAFEGASFVVDGQTYEEWQSYYFDLTNTTTSFARAIVTKR